MHVVSVPILNNMHAVSMILHRAVQMKFCIGEKCAEYSANVFSRRCCKGTIDPNSDLRLEFGT